VDQHIFRSPLYGDPGSVCLSRKIYRRKFKKACGDSDGIVTVIAQALTVLLLAVDLQAE